MQAQRYRKAEDFYRAQAALMQWVKRAGHRNYLHKGDIGHRLFNNCYGFDPAEVFRYWLDADGEIAAFALLSAQRHFLELHLAPPLMCSSLHGALFQYCEGAIRRFGERIGKPLKEIALEADSRDSKYVDFIRARGYSLDKHSITMTRHDLQSLPAAELPPGFRFHDATAADAEQLADVHNHTFTNKWNATSYGEVFRAPHMERELVAVAPDGRFAAFTNIWLDDVNRSLLFEPVGTHSDFRRRGIGKALMVYAMKRVRAAGSIDCAYVCHEPPAENPASSALYASVGFEELREFYMFRKALLV